MTTMSTSGTENISKTSHLSASACLPVINGLRCEVLEVFAHKVKDAVDDALVHPKGVGPDVPQKRIQTAHAKSACKERMQTPSPPKGKETKAFEFMETRHKELGPATRKSRRTNTFVPSEITKSNVR